MSRRLVSKFMLAVVTIALVIVIATAALHLHLSRVATEALIEQSLQQYPEAERAAGRARLDATQQNMRRDALYLTLLAGLGLLVLALGIGALAMRGITRPLSELAGEARQLGDGDYAPPADTGRRDELGKLGHAFRQLRERLRETTISRDYLDQLLAGLNEALIVVDDDDRIVRTNPAACRLLCRTADTLQGMTLAELLPEDRRDSLAGHDDQRARESVFVRGDDTQVPVSLTCSRVTHPETDFSGRIISARDISERKRAEQRIRYLARIDSLTKVPNRMQFQHLLQRALARARKRGEYLALLYIDVDRFKDVNDTFGHLAGDVSLETFCQRVCEVLPDTAIVGRLAGDEFAVCLRDFRTLDAMMATLDTVIPDILRSVGRSMRVQGHELYLTASMGVARYPLDGGDVIDLIRNADAALYHAKKVGGNCHAFYTPDMNAEAVERLMLKSKLRRAFERNELTLRYQPKYGTHDGRVMGAEALVRWEMPERGMVLPADFVPLAEETNLILDLGEWVLDQVCADYRHWQRSIASPGRVSVNLSLKQLRQQNFLERVKDIFTRHQVSPTCLELEITETTLMEDAERTIRMLEALYRMGLHLAIDDFGTGYSSLSAMQHFPISTLKIDRSFIRDLPADRNNATIVATVIQMAHNLEMEVVAEGVETEAQLAFLREHDCDYVQGMLFGEPFSADDYADLLLRQIEGTDRHRTLFA